MIHEAVSLEKSASASALASQVGFETEGTAIFDTMQFVKNEVRRSPCC